MSKLKGKKQLVTLTAILIAVVLVAVGFFGFWYLQGKTKENKTSVTCGDVKISNEADKSVVPFNPILMASIGGEYNQNNEACELTLDGKLAGKFKPINNECKFDSLKILASGNYEIGYKLNGNAGQFCTKTTKVTVGTEKKATVTKDEEEGYKLYVKE